MKSLLDAGALLNFGSDAPVETPNPIEGIGAAVTRNAYGFDEPWIPEERIDVDDAVKAYTIWASESVGCDGQRGFLRPGHVADIAVLSKDIYAIDPDGIRETTVDLTMVDGDIVHRSSI
jgi:predicted amidohydrolase YtcJ